MPARGEPEQQQQRSAVDVVRALFEAYSNGQLEEGFALLHPDVVIEPATRPGRSAYLGKSEARVLSRDLSDAADQGLARFDDFVELPDGRIRVTGRQIRVTGSGYELGPHIASIVTVRHGLVVHIETVPPEDA